MAHPEALTVIGKNAQRGLCLVAKNKESAAKRIDMEHLPTHAAQAVNTLAEVDRLQANENAHLRGYLDNRPRFRKQLSNSMHCGGTGVAVWILSSNRAGDLTSMRHRPMENSPSTFNSINSGEAVRCERPRIRVWFLKSNRSAFEIWQVEKDEDRSAAASIDFPEWGPFSCECFSIVQIGRQPPASWSVVGNSSRVSSALFLPHGIFSRS